MKKLEQWLSQLPNRLWPFKQSGFFYNAYRELWHFAGGCLIGLITWPLSLVWPGFWIVAPLFTLWILVAVEHHQWYKWAPAMTPPLWKPFVDIAFWLSGFVLLFFLVG